MFAAWLRWQYIVNVQPNPDEFVTLLAVKMILQKGVPVLPSGLFYEHGLLFSYAGAATSALLGFSREVVRGTSLAFGLLSVALTWYVGRRWHSPTTGLLAATLLTVAPAAVLWGGRARMYTLLQCWVLLTLYFAYIGSAPVRSPGFPSRASLWHLLALVCYLGAVLTQFVSITLIPPLVLGTVATGWLRISRRGERPWFQTWWAWLRAGGLIAVALIAFLVKRAGQPKGTAPLEATGTGLVAGIAQVATIYGDLSADLAGGWEALAPFFTAPETVLPSILALVATGWAGLNWLHRRPSAGDVPTLFLALILLVTTLEMIFFVSPERRDDKYLVMLQPALLLLAADGLARLGSRISDHISANRKIGSSAIRLSAVLALVACLALIAYNWSATESLLARSGPDYDTAFSYVRDQWQAGDAVLTGTPAAAALYLGRNDYYAVRGTGGYAYRILERDAQKVERWMGSTWLETDEDIQAALSGSPRVWLILERWGLIEEYYAPVTMQRILAMTDFVREDNGIIVLRSIPAAQLIPESPPVGASVNFGHLLRLEGYHLTRQPGESSDEEKDSLSLVLYWQALRPLPYDYTVFVHLRDADGQAVVQADHQPLVPIYPPTLWPVGQTIRERSTLDISGQVPPGTYMLWVGVYRLDTLERLPIIGDKSGENAYLLAEEVVD